MWDGRRIADPRLFLDRSQEQKQLRRLLEERDNVLIYGQRRLGKTSLIRRVEEDMGLAFLYVDCNFVDSSETLGQQILAALCEAKLARVRQFIDWVKDAASGLQIGVELKDDGVRPFLRRQISPSRPLQDVLKFVTRIAIKAKQPLVLVLDEFQTVMHDAPDAIAKLRGHAQEQQEVSYVIAGSQPSILAGLTRHKNPFWRQLTELPIGPIDVHEALQDAARILDVPIPADVRDQIQAFTRGNTQRLAELLAIIVQVHQCVFTVAKVDEAIQVLLGRHEASFERIVSSLRTTQRRLCIALAVLEPEHPTGSQFFRHAGIPSPSHVQRALGALQRGEVIDEEGRFVDPAFQYWMQEHGRTLLGSSEP